MISEKEIEDLIRKKIDEEVKPGDKAGGSGHMAHVSYEITEIKTKKRKDNKIQVNYTYKVYTETEFTYYPDNPPYEDVYHGEMVISD